MNCVIPGPNIKILGKALQALSKVGDELYFESKKDNLTLMSLNLTKTVCTQFIFFDSFFSTFQVDENAFTQELEDSITFKIHMKAILTLFRGNIEKRLDFFKMEYSNNSDLVTIKMKYKDDILVHNVRLLESEPLIINLSTDGGVNNICAASSFYNQLLTMFAHTDDEISLEVNSTKVVARNYCIGAPYHPKSMRSQVNLNQSEFMVYDINLETSITFSLRPFRTAIHFAEGFNLNVGFNFDSGGKPLTLFMKNPTFQVNFIIATLNPNNDLASTMTTQSIPSKIVTTAIANNNNNKVNITIEDQQALENENWDDCDLDINNQNTNNNNKVNNKKSDNTGSSSDSNNKFLTNMATKSTKSSKSIGSFKTKSSDSNNSFNDLMNKAMDALEGLKNSSKDSLDKSTTNNNMFKIRNNDIKNINCENDLETSNFSNNEVNDDDVDIVPKSPESPRSKKAKFIFGRCYDPTFHSTVLGEVLAGNSDSE